MPNWCSNAIYVKGPKVSLDALENLLKTGETEFDFNLFLPYPQEFKVLPDEGHNQGGYDWCVENWGTKWNASDPSREHPNYNTYDYIAIWFESAWSPPLGVVQAMSKKFQDLLISIEYEERGNALAGFSTFKNGVEVEKGERQGSDEDDQF